MLRISLQNRVRYCTRCGAIRAIKQPVYAITQPVRTLNLRSQITYLILACRQSLRLVLQRILPRHSSQKMRDQKWRFCVSKALTPMQKWLMPSIGLDLIVTTFICQTYSVVRRSWMISVVLSRVGDLVTVMFQVPVKVGQKPFYLIKNYEINSPASLIAKIVLPQAFAMAVK